MAYMPDAVSLSSEQVKKFDIPVITTQAELTTCFSFISTLQRVRLDQWVFAVQLELKEPEVRLVLLVPLAPWVLL